MINLKAIPHNAESISILQDNGVEVDIVKMVEVNPQRFELTTMDGQVRIYNADGVNQFKPSFNIQRIQFIDVTRSIDVVKTCHWMPRLVGWKQRVHREPTVQCSDALMRTQGLMTDSWIA